MIDIAHEIRHCMDATTRLLHVTENPLHAAMLRNYRRHVHLEGSGQFEKIVAPDMMADDPVYRVNWGDDAIVVEGRDDVLAFYRSVSEAVLWNTANRLAVADWGIADELTFHQLVTGNALAGRGFQIDDPDAYYHYESRQAFVWPYDEQARLKGEHLYEDRSSIRIEPVALADVITPQQAAAIHLELLAELDDEAAVPARRAGNR
ncbi:hypothetical protein SAOR_07210 [Salinisphaera orenii MK-B5]|uniref:Uncharacterized protein n=1 Tax=Salinisphaera orenii MK-B5 TaxID=856730 RepID=A0A423PQ02_9GAMM|nr:hypothetical protein [Salinisphaera orenii]ROO27632.1 hypothetical protein SAOR_07210 [Salinisphaera orenii MK-B5]